jgi:hypothetical protein
MEKYLLLCRHGRHRNGQLLVDEETEAYPSEDVAAVLREELLFGRRGIRLETILFASTPEARETASILIKGLGGRQPSPATARLEARGDFQVSTPAGWGDPQRTGSTGTYKEYDTLNPERFRFTGNANRAAAAIARLLGRGGDGCALLVVGHQPQLSWLSDWFTGQDRGRRWQPWHSGPVPVAHGEIICLAVTQTSRGWWRPSGRWRGHVQWSITPDDRPALSDVREKVKSKMETAKLLSGVITLVVTALLGVLLDKDKWDGLGMVTATPLGLKALQFSGQLAVQVSFGLLMGALGLYLMTMYAYDSLLMPPRFWAELPARDQPEGSWRAGVERRLHGGTWLPRRPPSSSAWVVYRNMMRIWYTLFTPATLLVAAALIVLASALLRLPAIGYVLVAVAAAGLGLWRFWFRPVLGSED